MMTLILIRGRSAILFIFILICILLFSLNQVCFFGFFSGGGYSGNQENRYVGFGNTVTPEKKEDDFINNAMSSIYSVGHNIYIFLGQVVLFVVFFFSFEILISFFSGLEQFHCWS